jgi:hypothetical protein
MSGYAAAVGTAPDVVSGEFYTVSVLEVDDQGFLTDTVAMADTPTGVRVTHPPRDWEALEAGAERVLEANGWRTTEGWDASDNAIYADVERAGE